MEVAWSTDRDIGLICVGLSSWSGRSTVPVSQLTSKTDNEVCGQTVVARCSAVAITRAVLGQFFCGGKGDLGLHRYEHLYSPRMAATKRKIQITKPIYHCGKRCERNQKLGASPPAEVPSLRLQRAARHRRVQVDEERTERVSGRVCTTILHSQQQTIPALLSSPSFHLARQTTPHHTLSSSRVCLDEMNFNRRRLSRINWLRRRRRQMSPLPLLWRPETDGNERRRVDRDVLQSRYTLYF